MFGVFEVKQGPELCIRSEDNIAPFSAITPVGAAVGQSLSPEKMSRARTSVSGAAVDFNIIYEIGIGQN